MLYANFRLARQPGANRALHFLQTVDLSANSNSLTAVFRDLNTGAEKVPTGDMAHGPILQLSGSTAHCLSPLKT